MTTAISLTPSTPLRLSKRFMLLLSAGSFRCFCCALFLFFQAGVVLAQEPRYVMADTAVAMRLLKEAMSLMDSARYDAALGKLDTAGVILEGTVGREDTVYARVSHQKGICFFRKGDFNHATEHLQKSLNIRLNSLGPEHPVVASSYNGLGIICDVTGEFDEAIKYNQKALKIQIKNLGFEHLDVARSYNILGSAYFHKGDYDMAVEYYEKGLEIQLNKLGTEHLHTASIYNNLGNVYFIKSDYGHAVDCYQKSLEISLKRLGPMHPEVATTYSNLGMIYTTKNDYDKAIEYYQISLEIRSNILGVDHLDVATSFSNLGNVYLYKGDYDQSIEYHRNALKIRLNIFGDDHIALASSYNDLGDTYSHKGDNAQAIHCYQKSLEIMSAKLDKNHPSFSEPYTSLGGAYNENADYDKAIEYYQKSLEIDIKTFGSDHPKIAQSYGGLGDAYSGKSDYNKAIEYYQKSLKIILTKLGFDHIGVAAFYSRLGGIYNDKGHYDRSFEYFQKALEIKLKKLSDDHPSVASTYQDLGDVYLYKCDYDRANVYHQKCLTIRLNTLDTNHLAVAESFSRLGISCFVKDDYDGAIKYYKKELEIRLAKSGTNHPSIAVAYENLGYAFDSKGDYARSLEYFKKALEIQLNKLSNNHPRLACCYSALGYAYFKKYDYNRAIEHHQKALEIQLKKFGIGHPDVINSYHRLAEIFKSMSNYDQSTDYFNKAVSAINVFRRNLENPSYIATTIENTAKVYENAISTTLLLHNRTDSVHYLHEAFHYAEQSKAQSLYESMKNTDALHFAGIPDSLLGQEYDLRIDIAYNDKRRHDLLDSGKSETDTTVLTISSKRFDLHRAYEALMDTFEARYPDYYRLKYDFSTAGIQEVQDLLPGRDHTLLEYVAGDSSVFIFVIRKDTFAVVELKKDFPLDALVDSLRASIVGQKVETYCRLAYLLYQKLILPVEPLLTEKLIIIPDGKLGYLPFDALLTEQPWQPLHFRGHPYLLRKHQISYCYSATLLREMGHKQHRKPAKKTLLAFAPFYDGRTVPMPGRTRKNLDPLPHTGEEVRGARRIAGKGDIFYGKEASKERFVKSAGDYNILHLAQHAQASDESSDYSFLAFAGTGDSLDNELLFVRDLYNLSLNADMVVLSACETGIGRLQRGEGIISLGRAFAYSGAKSIVASLWRVEDEASKNLMLGFYSYLKQGMSKDAALRRAKLDYIGGGTHVKAHPFFWAGFGPVGDMRAIFGK